MLKGLVFGLTFLACAAPAAAQGHPFGVTEPALLYYVSIPLAGRHAGYEPTVGFAIQGRHASHVVRVDTQTLQVDRLFRLNGGEAFDAKWLLVGGVAAGVALIAAKSASAKPSEASPAAATSCSARPAC